MNKNSLLFILLLLLAVASCKKQYRCRVCNDGSVARDQFAADPCGDGSNRYDTRSATGSNDPYKNNMYCTSQ